MASPASAVCSPGANKNPKLKAIPDVEIERSGKFKYILIKVHDPSKEREFKHIVRGNSKAAFHGKIMIFYIIVKYYCIYMYHLIFFFITI